MKNFERGDRCCSPCHNRQKLSAALIKPCSRDTCDIPVSCDNDFASMQNHHGHSIKSCGCDRCDIPARCERDFASVQNHHGHSKNRRFVREYFSGFRPIAYCNSFWWSPQPMPMMQWAPAPLLRPMAMIPWRSPSFHHGFGDGFFRNHDVVEIQEQRCQPCRCAARCVHQPAAIVKELKIRPRPTSCHDLRQNHRHEKRIDVHHHINVNCNHSRTASPLPPPPPPPPPPPQPCYCRPCTHDTGTFAPTREIPHQGHLTFSDTEKFDLYEENGKIKRDNVTTTITHKTFVVKEPVKVTTCEFRNTSNFQRADAVNQVERGEISMEGHQQIGGFQKTEEFQRTGRFQNSEGFQQTQEFQQIGGHQQSESLRRIGGCEQTGSGLSTSVSCSSSNCLNGENVFSAHESLSPCIRSIVNASKQIDSQDALSSSTQPFFTQKTSETRRIVTSN
ncbi:unnamed protein product [Rotaria magnacalcarata]|uniref:Uncharacterized protein n=2 Tax=Rotaria magnacalcarata TaxID=392030 RepID=A0A819I814_9BILA|nr:unnamed protein product [Rotaria magnacalcarata]CAF3910270.1 unnamed protein product [Rotaria magnacalcarata]